MYLIRMYCVYWKNGYTFEFRHLLGMFGQKSFSHLYKHVLKRFILIKCDESFLLIPAERVTLTTFILYVASPLGVWAGWLCEPTHDPNVPAITFGLQAYRLASSMRT